MHIVSGRLALLVLLLPLVFARPTAGQDPPPPSPQQLFEAGQYDQAIQRIGELRAQGAAGLREAFLAGHVRIRQNQLEPAKAEFNILAASEDAVWRLVGQSSIALVDNNLDGAVDLATQATTAANNAAATAAPGQPPDPAAAIRDFHAFYQLGLARSRRDDWAGALEAFERASTLDPTFAYGHYYAGLSASRVQRPDRMAVHFQQFLQLAPNAPEQAAVASLMRTLRGF